MLYVAYHDNEWGKYRGPDDRSDNELFEMFVLESFQSGLSWLTILRKRDGFRKAFDGFDFTKVAEYDAEKEAELVANADIIRHRGKIRAAIANANALKAVVDEFGSFDAYLRSMLGAWTPECALAAPKTVLEDAMESKTAESEALAKDLKKRGFKFMGPTTAYAFLQATGFVNDHVPGCVCHPASGGGS
ncbi:DNA-3-methyladenine glycosylase I [Thecamonas trahens ATCC 50062]|uniref:DNA-3-methyladenine glycosylase I n=1 Tax=Thecamonas trahens ATCC 50062 TaxID=461836 RepID=A0A0L0DS07_THETB|nr:DNA-3-methyladenine glycosylase I [Thecamonas trahens ATCC 50062]KNC54218.1 DNA-3-methyladenine glycosylase I [Thecamonas trahens ATCC 50062]|eukprot:XP_013753857.1 DNA-3-methyladenine glycosylase I [Thecamonas trahens ATCC 50062]